MEPAQIAAPVALDPAKNYKVTCHDRVVFATGARAQSIANELAHLYEIPAKIEEA